MKQNTACEHLWCRLLRRVSWASRLLSLYTGFLSIFFISFHLDLKLFKTTASNTPTTQVTHLCICSGLSGPPSSVQARVAWLRLGKEQRRRKGVDEPPGLSWTAGEQERSGSVSRRSRERDLSTFRNPGINLIITQEGL